MSIKPIETVYRGYKFRSRLEARHAVFLDAAGVRFEYEPEGYDLGEDGWYLPDFWLPRQKAWLEIKPSSPADAERRKAAILAEGTGYTTVIFCGSEFEPFWFDDDVEFRGMNGYVFWPGRYDDEGDFHGGWIDCTDCGVVPICGAPGRCRGSSRSGLLKAAYAAAKQARFGRKTVGGWRG